MTAELDWGLIGFILLFFLQETDLPFRLFLFKNPQSKV